MQGWVASAGCPPPLPTKILTTPVPVYNCELAHVTSQQHPTGSDDSPQQLHVQYENRHVIRSGQDPTELIRSGGEGTVKALIIYATMSGNGRAVYDVVKVVVVIARPLVTPAARVRFPDQAHMALLGVKTWLSTLETVYLCVFRMRH